MIARVVCSVALASILTLTTVLPAVAQPATPNPANAPCVKHADGSEATPKPPRKPTEKINPRKANPDRSWKHRGVDGPNPDLVPKKKQATKAKQRSRTKQQDPCKKQP